MPTENALPPSQKNNEAGPGDAEDEPEEPVKILEKQGTFDELTVWGHETVPAADDPFVKGVEEWMKLAEAVCELLCVLSWDIKQLMAWIRCI